MYLRSDILRVVSVAKSDRLRPLIECLKILNVVFDHHLPVDVLFAIFFLCLTHFLVPSAFRVEINLKLYLLVSVAETEIGVVP